MKRWLIFALAVSAFWFSFFHRIAPGAVARDLTEAFNVSGAALGALAATYFYVYALMQLPTGVLADTLGPRKVLTTGLLTAGLGSIAFAGAESIVPAALGRTLVGLGVSVAWICVMKLIATWFEESRFATLTGWANVVGITGAFAATAPLAWLVTFVSWRTVFTSVGVISLVLAALVAWKVRDAPFAREAPRAQAPRESWREALGGVLRNRATWPTFWVSFGLSGTNMSFIGLWAVPFLTASYAMSTVEASRHTSVMLAGYAFSTVFFGWSSDRMRRRKPIMILAAAGYLACWAAWIGGVSREWTYVLAAGTGFLVSGLSLSWACAKEVNAPGYAGMATSVANVGGFIAAGILQPLVGWAIDLGLARGLDAAAAHRTAMFVFALFTAIGLAGALFIRETRCRNIWNPSTASA